MSISVLAFYTYDETEEVARPADIGEAMAIAAQVSDLLYVSHVEVVWGGQKFAVVREGQVAR